MGRLWLRVLGIYAALPQPKIAIPRKRSSLKPLIAKCVYRE
jgi:hypothetical protein